MRALLIILAGAIAFTACETRKPESIVIEKHKVLEVFRNTPRSIHEEITPRWRAVLDNGDTVACSDRVKLGDSITYEFIKYGRE